MNNDEQSAIEILLNKIYAEENINEYIEINNQEVVKMTKLAKNMFPSKEQWEELGFEFFDIPNDDVLYKAKLPKGWSIKRSNQSMCSEITDENDNVRGEIFYKSRFYDRSAFMGLRQRYDICTVFNGDLSNIVIEVYFGNKEEKLFVAGKIELAKYKKDTIEKINELKELAKEFADQNYPGWDNVQTYWNNSETKKLIKNNLRV